jgi:hypothetical protein
LGFYPLTGTGTDRPKGVIRSAYRELGWAGDGDEQAAVELVTRKYIEEFAEKYLYLFVGTTKHYHNVGPNPFVILSCFTR